MTATDNAVRLARVAAAAANEKKADSIVAFDVSEHLFITDIFLVCSASNAPQMSAVKDEIEAALAGPVMATTPAGPPAGWYADKQQPDLMRWWDGQQWTDVTQPKQ